MNATQTEDRVELVVHGMHCGGCVANVERALRHVPGVASASVNLTTAQAVVELDSTRPGVDDELIAAVTALGFEAKRHTPARDLVAERQQRRAEDLARRKRGLLIGAAAGIPAIALHFVGHALGWPMVTVWLIEAALTLVVIVAAAGSMIAGAVKALLRFSANMDLLVALGTLTAFVTGWIGIAAQAADMVIFHAAVMIVLFVSLGKYFEARARGQASGALEALLTRIPATALKVVNGQTQQVDTAAVMPDDKLRLVPHAAVPVDGRVVRGRITVDESMLTGESLPVERGEGDEILGGTRVTDGDADMTATATGSTSAAARVAKLVEEAQSSKPPWQRLADRVAGVFVPIVVALALATFAGWLLGGADWFTALKRAIAVLVVACPCAMGLAIPTAVLVGTSRAAERGMLVRDASALEAAGSVREVLLDKTGTLTIGQPALDAIDLAGGFDESQVVKCIASVERFSEHPLAVALRSAAESRSIALSDPQDLTSQAGRGVAGVVDGRRVVAGRAEWLREQGIEPPADAIEGDPADARSVILAGIDGEFAGVLRFADPLHAEAADAIRALRDRGVAVRILSGDRESAVRSVAEQLGIEAWSASLSPDEKLAQVRERVAAGVRVAMVGDGINDAPALAAADVGIAIGTGADVAREAADVCLVGHSPLLIERAIHISRVSAGVMKQNLFWAFAYNLIMLPIAMLTSLPPAAATAAMMLSSLSVVGNSLRLRRII